jgi:hypothetical protein
METKTCKRCTLDKSIEEFGINGKYRRSSCKKCECLAALESKNVMGWEEWNKKQSIRRKNNPLTDMISAAKRRAKNKSLPFDIGPEDLKIPEYCPILGLRIEPKPYEPGKKSAGATPNSPSLDRIVPELGYVKGNVQVISYQANAMKNAANSRELHKFAEWVLREVPNA